MFVDHYEILQISPNADTETIRRVYRMQAQRFHPDNLDSGHGSSNADWNQAAALPLAGGRLDCAERICWWISR